MQITSGNTLVINALYTKFHKNLSYVSKEYIIQTNQDFINMVTVE